MNSFSSWAAEHSKWHGLRILGCNLGQRYRWHGECWHNRSGVNPHSRYEQLLTNSKHRFWSLMVLERRSRPHA
jgi:hypothetical protein